VTSALAALHEAVAIQHGVHRAHCRRLDHRELADRLDADLRSTPEGVLVLDPHDGPLDLVRELVGMATGSA